MSEKSICFLDGNALCIVNEDFVNIQESPCMFITLNKKALKEFKEFKESNSIKLNQKGKVYRMWIPKEAAEARRKYFNE